MMSASEVRDFVNKLRATFTVLEVNLRISPLWFSVIALLLTMALRIIRIGTSVRVESLV